MTASHFQSEHYPDWDEEDQEGTECRCRVTLNVDYLADPLGVDMWGDASGGDDQIPSAVQFVDPDGDPRPSSSVAVNEDRWSSDGTYGPGGYGEATEEGTWEFYISMLTRAGTHASSCGDHEGVEIEFTVEGRSASPLPARPASPVGLESDRDCLAGQNHTTRFRLVAFPAWQHALPLPVGGHSRFAGSRLTGISVADWHGADRLVWRNGTGERTLTPESPQVALPAGDWWHGTSEWHPARVADPEPWSFPEVEAGHSCPAAPAAPTVQVDVGYGLSLAALDEAVADATGGAGVGWLVTGAPEPDWPVYAVRVVPLAEPEPGVATHLLRLELRGTKAATSIPMLATGEHTRSLATDGPTLVVQGTVSRGPNTLTLDFEGGVLHTPSGPLDLLPATIALPALGEVQ